MVSDEKNAKKVWWDFVPVISVSKLDEMVKLNGKVRREKRQKFWQDFGPLISVSKRKHG